MGQKVRRTKSNEVTDRVTVEYEMFLVATYIEISTNSDFLLYRRKCLLGCFVSKMLPKSVCEYTLLDFLKPSFVDVRISHITPSISS